MSEYVYILKPKHSNVYKIGQTTSLERRIKQLEKKFSFSLVYVHTVETEDSFQVEQRLHLDMSRYHLGGDWFALDDVALAWVMKRMEELK